MYQALFLKRSLISVSSTSSLVATGAGAGAASCRRFILLIAFTIRKIINARIRKLMTSVAKFPQANTGPIFLASSKDVVGCSTSFVCACS